MQRSGRIALQALIGLHIATLFAGFLSPYDPARQNRQTPFAPPTRLHFIDEGGRFHAWPFVYPLRAAPDGSYTEDRSRPFPVRFLVAGDAYGMAGDGSARIHLFGVEEPAALFLMGTDDLGRDQFSRFLHGAQVSLWAGPAAALLALSLGFLIGTGAGYYGGRVDEILMMAVELFVSLPWLYLLLAVRALLPLDLGPQEAFFVIISILGAIGWARPARIIRGVVMSARQRDFVMAARGFGASELYLLRRHVAPQARGVTVAQAALLIPQYILAEITMSFLGVGVGEPAASWGLLLARLQQYHALTSHWWMWLPALLLIPIFCAYYALAVALGGFHYTKDSRYI